MPKTEESVLTVTPARDIIIANTRRVVCPVCGKLIGRTLPEAKPNGVLYFCPRCSGYRRVEVNTVTVP